MYKNIDKKCKNCKKKSQVMSSHHSDQISQRSQVSRVDLCVHHSPLTHLLRWVTRSPIELLWTAKNWAEWKQLKGQEGRCKCGGRRSWVAWCGQPCIPSTADPRPHYLLWQPCPHPTMVVSTFLSTGSRLPSVHSVSKQSTELCWSQPTSFFNGSSLLYQWVLIQCKCCQWLPPP